MELRLRKFNDYAFVEIKVAGVTADLGTFDNKDARQLLEHFENAVEELKWFINATDKE